MMVPLVVRFNSFFLEEKNQFSEFLLKNLSPFEELKCATYSRRSLLLPCSAARLYLLY
jgi:hypothetical protein